METTKELLDKICDTRHLKFLELYPQCECSIKLTAKTMGLNRHTIHGWLREDEDLNTAFTSLKKDLEVELEEYYLSVISNVVEGEKTPPQSRLLGSFFMLKALNPRYKDKTDATINIGSIELKGFLPPGQVIELPPEAVREITEGGEDNDST